MSELSVRYAGHKVSEVPPADLRLLIGDFIDETDFIMSASTDKNYLGKLLGWSYKFINEKYSYMPVNHIKAAYEYGSQGQREGTSKLSPRNIAIWLSEQCKIFQEQYAIHQRQADEKKKREEMKSRNAMGQKVDSLVGTAVRIKVTWLANGAINGEQYDSFSSQAIYEMLKMGIPETDLHPRDFVKDYGRR
jgi:hypothetical protein